jgi:hypothetical protein
MRNILVPLLIHWLHRGTHDNPLKHPRPVDEEDNEEGGASVEPHSKRPKVAPISATPVEAPASASHLHASGRHSLPEEASATELAKIAIWQLESTAQNALGCPKPGAPHTTAEFIEATTKHNHKALKLLIWELGHEMIQAPYYRCQPKLVPQYRKVWATERALSALVRAGSGSQNGGTIPEPTELAKIVHAWNNNFFETPSPYPMDEGMLEELQKDTKNRVSDDDLRWDKFQDFFIPPLTKPGGVLAIIRRVSKDGGKKKQRGVAR